MVSTWCIETHYRCWLKYGQYVHGAKRPTAGAGSNTVSIWRKETYYGCWLKYGQ